MVMGRDEILAALEGVLAEAKRISEEVGQEVEEILRLGRENPLSRDELVGLLSRVVDTLQRRATERGDRQTAEELQGKVELLISKVIRSREELEAPTRVMDVGPRSSQFRKMILDEHGGKRKEPVLPRPWFHGKEIPMWSGFVKTTELSLWDRNERLEIHLGQFQQTHGRSPTPEELLDIMLSQTVMPGVTKEDQFEIVDLARSIAINGVRKPPILDIDGSLLDGNRRVAACHFILNNDEFESEEKLRAEYIFCWQLTEHANDDDRRRVVVSLNFEPDCKQDWPEYVKARKVYEEWETILSLEPRGPGPKRLAELKKDLSRRYALGPDSGTVNRYLKMVEWANQFEEHHIQERKRDKFEVKHKANRYFQYFDEMAKGTSAGGVAHSLNQDDGFRRLVFDLLFDGKFRNWRQIRELKYISENDEAKEEIRRAREEADLDTAEERMENAISIARTKRAEARTLGANTRIEAFVKWLEDLPVKAFRNEIRPENLKRLLEALRLVERQAAAVLEERVGPRE